MPRRAIRITPGLQQDDTAYKIGQGGYTSVNNLRPHKGSMETTGGFEKRILDTLDGVCRVIHSWEGSDGEILTAFGTNTKLYVLEGGEIKDITPTSGFTAGDADAKGGIGYGTGAYGVGNYGEPSNEDYFALTWSLDNYGSKLIANPRGQGIFEWDSGDANATIVANAPTEVTFMRVTPTRQIMAYGCNEETSGTFNARCIRFSDIEDIDDWTTSATNNAGEHILQDAGRIVSAVEVGDFAFVFTNNGVFLETYTGSPTQLYDYSRLGGKTGSGLCGPNAATVLGQTCFYISPDFRLWAVGLGGSPTRIENPIGSNLVDDIEPTQADKVVLGTVSEFQEILIYYQSRGGSDVDKFYSVSASNNQWGAGDVGRSAYIDANPNEYPLAVSPDGAVYWHEKGYSADGGARSWSAETGFIHLNGERALRLRGIWPDFKNQIGAVNLTVTTRMFPQGSETVNGPFKLTPNMDKYDFLTVGSFIKLKFEGTSAPARVRFGEINLDVKVSSKR